MPDDPKLSQDRIDAAPAEIRALFYEYDMSLVFQALTAAGINDDPATFTPQRLQEGIATARLLLQAEMRRRAEAMLDG